MMDIQRNMAAALQAYKIANGRSLTELSEELEISRSTLQDYLAGTGNPNLSTISHVADKMGMDAAFLLAGDLSHDQAAVFLKMMEALKLMDALSPRRRRRFSALLLEMLHLWDGEAENDECEGCKE